MPVPKWKKFISLTENKTSLIRFLGRFLADNGPVALENLTNDLKIVLAGCASDSTKVLEITKSGVGTNDIGNAHIKKLIQG